MSASSTWRLFRRTVLVALLADTSSCAAPPMRLPLAVPLPAVGGSRPATPQGLWAFAEFGDGVWGQEQERVEVYGVGVGFATRDRFEFSVSSHQPTRDRGGEDQAEAVGVRGKIRLGDLVGGRASIAVHIARTSTARKVPGVQDERMSAWDVALPLTFYPAGDQFIDHRWGVYVAPRLVFQKFEDRMTSEATKGTLAAALLGVTARWTHVAVTGEMNLAHTPSLSLGNTTFQGKWTLLPMASLTLSLPIGEQPPASQSQTRTASATSQAVPNPGDRIRIRQMDGTVLTGTLTTLSPETIQLSVGSDDRMVDVPVEGIESLEISLGQQHNYRKYFSLTVAVTSIVGATIGFIAYEDSEPCSFLCFGPDTRTEYIALGFAGGVLVGLPLGAIIGSAVREERWNPASLPAPAASRLTIHPVIGGRVGFAGSVRVGGF